MRKILTILILTIFILGCNQQIGGTSDNVKSVKSNNYFTVYPYQTFIDEKTGETGLFIDGENWYTLIDLKGFEDENMPFSYGTQFLLQEDSEGNIISAFGDKIPSAKDSDSCLNQYVSTEEYKEYLKTKLNSEITSEIKKEINGKTILLTTTKTPFGESISLKYAPYYDGYCMDFHFTVKNMEKVSKIIDSIKFVEGSFSGVKINKLIYTPTTRTKLSVPDDWNYYLNEKKADSISSVEFWPGQGNSFKFFVSILNAKDNGVNSVSDLKEKVQDSMNIASESTVVPLTLKELKNKNNIVYYYSGVDKNYDSSNPDDFPNMVQGDVLINGVILYFTILYRDENKNIAEQGLNIIANAKVLDLLNPISDVVEQAEEKKNSQTDEQEEKVGTFLKNTGETGIYMTNHKWYVLIDLKGFNDSPLEDSFVKDGAIFDKFKDYKSAYLYVFFIPKPLDLDSYLDYTGRSNISEIKKNQTVDGKTYCLYQKNLQMKHFYYFIFKENFAFEFHFTLNSDKLDIFEITNIIDSIKFVDEDPNSFISQTIENQPIKQEEGTYDFNVKPPTGFSQACSKFCTTYLSEFTIKTSHNSVKELYFCHCINENGQEAMKSSFFPDFGQT